MSRCALSLETVRPLGLAALAITCCALVALFVFSQPGQAWTQESAHASLALLWNLDGGGECEAVEMELLEDYTWTITTVFPGPPVSFEAPRFYFKFMVDGSLTPDHYGKDLTRSDGVVLATDPPSIVAGLDGQGYQAFTLLEDDLTYSVQGAPGAFQVLITYENTPDPVPVEVIEATRVAVVDVTSGLTLGTYHYDLALEMIPVVNLLPGHDYALTFTAPGYQDLEITEPLPEMGPVIIEVTLQELVPANESSWGRIKVLYH